MTTGVDFSAMPHWCANLVGATWGCLPLACRVLNHQGADCEPDCPGRAPDHVLGVNAQHLISSAGARRIAHSRTKAGLLFAEAGHVFARE
jgi:hypothetical protein